MHGETIKFVSHHSVCLNMMKSFHQIVIQITEDNKSDKKGRMIALFGAAERELEHANG